MVESFADTTRRLGFTKGLIFSRELPEDPVVNYATENGIEIIPSSVIDYKLEEKGIVIKQIQEDFRKINNNLPLYENRDLFLSYIKEVESARESDDNQYKKDALEELTKIFLQSIGLEVYRNERTPSGEVDLWVNNNIRTPFWITLSTPIIAECKNVKKSASASDLRIFVDKMSGIKTGFFVSWTGITGSDEFRDAKMVVTKAWNHGKILIVLQSNDFNEIASGVVPDVMLDSKYQESLKQYCV